MVTKPEKGKKNPFENINRDSIRIIDRQWLRADHLKVAFYNSPAFRSQQKGENDFDWMTSYLVSPRGVYLCVWYAFVYSVLEGAIEKGVDPTSFKSYTEKLEDLLKKFRNSIFHNPPKYWDKRYIKLFGGTQLEDIEKLHEELGKYLEDSLNSKR